MSSADLSQFHLTLFVVGVLVHITMSAGLGLLYGVLMPTLPEIRKPLAWGGVLMPVFWTAANLHFDGGRQSGPQ